MSEKILWNVTCLNLWIRTKTFWNKNNIFLSSQEIEIRGCPGSNGNFKLEEQIGPMVSMSTETYYVLTIWELLCIKHLGVFCYPSRGTKIIFDITSPGTEVFPCLMFGTDFSWYSCFPRWELKFRSYLQYRVSVYTQFL